MVTSVAFHQGSDGPNNKERILASSRKKPVRSSYVGGQHLTDEEKCNIPKFTCHYKLGETEPYYIEVMGWENTVGRLKERILESRGNKGNCPLLWGVKDITQFQIYPPGLNTRTNEPIHPELDDYDAPIPANSSMENPLIVPTIRKPDEDELKAQAAIQDIVKARMEKRRQSKHAKKAVKFITIQVKTPEGDKIPVQLQKSDSMRFIKEQLAQAIGLDVPQQILRVAGKELANEQTAKDLGLVDGSVIFVKPASNVRTIQVRMPEGRTLSFKILPTDTIRSLKRTISLRRQASMGERNTQPLVLKFHGKELPLDQFAGAVGLEDGCVLDLMEASDAEPDNSKPDKFMTVQVRSPDGRTIPVKMKYNGKELPLDEFAGAVEFVDGCVLDLMEASAEPDKPDNFMTVQVRSPDGRTIPVKIQPSDTIGSIKDQAVIERTSQPLLMKCNGKELPLDATAEAIGLQDGSIIDLEEPVETTASFDILRVKAKDPRSVSSTEEDEGSDDESSSSSGSDSDSAGYTTDADSSDSDSGSDSDSDDEEEAKRKADEEWAARVAKRKAEDAQKKAQEEARLVEALAAKKAKEEARLAAAQKKRADEEAKLVEEAGLALAKKRAEEEARLAKEVAELERKAAEKQARKKAETEEASKKKEVRFAAGEEEEARLTAAEAERQAMKEAKRRAEKDKRWASGASTTKNKPKRPKRRISMGPASKDNTGLVDALFRYGKAVPFDWEKPEWTKEHLNLRRRSTAKNDYGDKLPAWAKDFVLKKSPLGEAMKQGMSLNRPMDASRKMQRRHSISNMRNATAISNSYGWEKPLWARRSVLKETTLGYAIKQGANLERLKKATRPRRHSLSDMRPSSTINNATTGWEKPVWARELGLKKTMFGDAIKQGACPDRPKEGIDVSSIYHRQRRHSDSGGSPSDLQPTGSTPMVVKVKTPHGKIIQLLMRYSDTIETIKVILASKVGIRVQTQVLMVEGKELPNAQTLDAVGLKEGSVIDLDAKPIRVKVQGRGGKMVPAVIFPFDTILSIKENVARKLGIAVRQQVLKYEGTELPDGETADSMGLKAWCVIQLQPHRSKSKQKS